MRYSHLKGRGIHHNPQNRFETLELSLDMPIGADGTQPATKFYKDTSKTCIAYNSSPDIGYNASINPYRGCEHGCVYCYARQTHEYLGFSAGLDFETRIMVKTDAPALLRKELSAKRWQPQVIGLGGVTDIYQPVERRLGLTRQCLEVLLAFRNPVAMVTKNQLITRDIDVLRELAAFDCVSVAISITTLQEELRRVMEPRTSTAENRLRAVRALADAGVHVGVLTAPIIPGLNDHEIPALVQASVEAGAKFVGYTLVHLPYSVKDVFASWLEQHFPDRKERVLNRIRETRGGKLNDPRFGYRMHGQGEYAKQVRALHTQAKRKAGLTRSAFKLSTEFFRVPGRATQPTLFDVAV